MNARWVHRRILSVSAKLFGDVEEALERYDLCTAVSCLQPFNGTLYIMRIEDISRLAFVDEASKYARRQK